MQPANLFQRYCELQRYVGWTDEDAQRVRGLAQVAERHFTVLINDFYAAIQQNPATARVITGGVLQIERLKGTLIAWLQELFSGRYDADYVARRWKVGLRHVEIGLDQVYTNAALSRLRSGLLLALENEFSDDLPSIMAARRSVNKLLDLDLAIIEDAYQTEMHRRQQQMERMATIGQVAGGIAHELRNPLNVIKTSVYYLRNSPKLSPEKTEVHLDRIDRQAEMADGVIGALNNFARLPVPEMEPMSVESCIREVFELNTFSESFQIKVEMPYDLPMVLGDRKQLGIVFTNLIRNARDAMPNGGLLTVRGRRDGTFVEIDVVDAGTGILPENLSKIMEPLFSTKARGIGLGLAISRAIVEKHHGQLKVKSETGSGATFTVRLLAAPSKESAVP